MPPHQLGHDPVRDVVDRVPGAVPALSRDPRVEHDLHHDVPELLAQRPLVTRLQRLHGLVGLLEQVRRERGMRLPGIPRAVHAQPVHGRDQVDEVRTGQVRRGLDQLCPLRNRRICARYGQPYYLTRHLVRVGKPVTGPSTTR